MLPLRRNAANGDVDFVGLAGRFLIDAADEIPIEAADLFHRHDAAAQLIGDKNGRHAGFSKAFHDGSKLRQGAVYDGFVVVSIMGPEII